MLATPPHNRDTLTLTLSFRGPDTAVCRAVGEVDMFTVGGLSSHLEQANCERGAHLVVDLSGLSFFAAAGYHALRRAQDRRGPGRLLVVVPSPCVRRVLSLCEQQAPAFSSAATCDAALTALDAA